MYALYIDIFYIREKKKMGYKSKMQRVERPTNQSYYITFPSALAQALNIAKGEEFEWEVENKNLIVLKRIKAKPLLKRKK